MFVEDYTGGTLERWSSTDGIHYTFVENVKSGGNQYKNPFIWLNPNDNNIGTCILMTLMVPLGCPWKSGVQIVSVASEQQATP